MKTNIKREVLLSAQQLMNSLNAMLRQHHCPLKLVLIEDKTVSQFETIQSKRREWKEGELGEYLEYLITQEPL